MKKLYFEMAFYITRALLTGANSSQISMRFHPNQQGSVSVTANVAYMKNPLDIIVDINQINIKT